MKPEVGLVILKTNKIIPAVTTAPAIQLLVQKF
jgi:hypothetical protein